MRLLCEHTYYIPRGSLHNLLLTGTSVCICRLPLVLQLAVHGLLRHPNLPCAKAVVDARLWVVGVRRTDQYYLVVPASKFEGFECRDAAATKN